jgi:hypothetical protein
MSDVDDRDDLLLFFKHWRTRAAFVCLAFWPNASAACKSWSALAGLKEPTVSHHLGRLKRLVGLSACARMPIPAGARLSPTQSRPSPSGCQAQNRSRCSPAPRRPATGWQKSSRPSSRMNETHPVHVTPSCHGDSVGHYEGDTLVIDSVGVTTDRPFAMVDVYGTPYSEALHVVERYRLVDYEVAKEAQERGAKENFRLQGTAEGWAPDLRYKGKGLQLHFAVEVEGVFTMPWSATITYRRALATDWREVVCAENTHEYYAGKDTEVLRADKPDF